MHYGEWLQSLPAPSAEQTARFAEHVAENHSWYKHLPFFPPGASFIVFPNAHAGRGVKAEGNRFQVYDIEQGDYFAHHSRLPTAEYRVQFGHWDYWVDDNPRALDPQPGPWRYLADGNRELLADDLKRQWSCRLTAFLKPAPPMFKLCANELQRELEAFMAASRPSLGRKLVALISGKRSDEHVFRRYREVARNLRDSVGAGYDSSLYSFMESEERAQREVLLSTLHRVREAWARGG